MSDEILSIGIVIIMALFAYIIWQFWNERRKARDFLNDSVTAFKVGIIRQKAKELKIDLVYPAKRDEFIDKIMIEVENELKDI